MDKKTPISCNLIGIKYMGVVVVDKWRNLECSKLIRVMSIIERFFAI